LQGAKELYRGVATQSERQLRLRVLSGTASAAFAPAKFVLCRCAKFAARRISGSTRPYDRSNKARE
jgi:hypothetical protein